MTSNYVGLNEKMIELASERINNPHTSQYQDDKKVKRGSK